jgi:hypothetical protein
MTAMDTIAGRVGQMDTQPSPLAPEVRDIFTREQAELAAGGLPGGVAPAGTVLPDADLLDLHGDPTTLSAATAGRLAVVVLYRGEWCPYCNVALGVLTGPTADGRAAQLRLGLDLTAVNADHTSGLPMPTALILGPDLVVRWIDVHPDYSTRSEPEQLLTALDQAVS